jgi:hypothetical protein
MEIEWAVQTKFGERESWGFKIREVERLAKDGVRGTWGSENGGRDLERIGK